MSIAHAAHAQGNCRITDPTGTPLNVRTQPNGSVVGDVSNGTLVTIADIAVVNDHGHSLNGNQMDSLWVGCTANSSAAFEKSSTVKMS
jgi:hypothetical protein